jgi:rubredoxin
MLLVSGSWLLAVGYTLIANRGLPVLFYENKHSCNDFLSNNQNLEARSKKQAARSLKQQGGMTMPSWKCSNCGYTFDADTHPNACPSCKEKCEFLDNTCYTPDCAAEGTDDRIAGPKK